MKKHYREHMVWRSFSTVNQIGGLSFIGANVYRSYSEAKNSLQLEIEYLDEGITYYQSLKHQTYTQSAHLLALKVQRQRVESIKRRLNASMSDYMNSIADLLRGDGQSEEFIQFYIDQMVRNLKPSKIQAKRGFTDDQIKEFKKIFDSYYKEDISWIKEK